MIKLSSCLKKQQNSTCIRATGMKISVIDILPASKCKCTSLSLSFNNISDLSNIKQFNLLSVLHLESNCIERISELEPLSYLPHLKNLSLSGNDVCCLPLFTAHVINLCPELQFLDGESVSSLFTGKYARNKFMKFLIQEKKCFKSIYINDFIVKVLKFKKKNHTLTQNCLNTFSKSQNYQNTIHDLRLRSKNLSPTYYFTFLKKTMIELYQFIFKTATLLELEKNILSQYSTILQSFEQIDHFNVFLEKAEQLDKLSLRLINLTENYFDENTFNEFRSPTHNLPNQIKKITHQTKNKIILSNSSDSISSQFCNSEDFFNKSQTQNKARIPSSVKSKKKGFIISSDDSDSASLSNDSDSHENYNEKSTKKAIENKGTTSPIRRKNLSSDFEFLSDPLKTLSSSEKITNEILHSKNKSNLELIHEEEPASEETLPKGQQSISSGLSNTNHIDDPNKSNLFLTELASEEIISKSQQSFSEMNPVSKAINAPLQINKTKKNNIKSDSCKNTSTEIEADEILFEHEKKSNNNNNNLHIQFLINQSISPELASDEITQNYQSDSTNQINNNDVSSFHQIINSEESNKNIHFPTSQVELASDEANQDSEPHTDSTKTIPSLAIEVASSSSSNSNDNFDQLSEGNENTIFKKNNASKNKPVQISTSLELASDETLPHSSIVHQQTSESDLQNGNTIEYKRKHKNDENDHQHHLKLPQSASLEFASDETLSNMQKSSSAFEDSASDVDLITKNINSKKTHSNTKIFNKKFHEDSKKPNSFVEEEELASEEGQNEEHVVLFDSKMKKARLDLSKEKHLKASQESFSLDEMASGETLPSANQPSSDDDSDYESENKKLFSFQLKSRGLNLQNNFKHDKNSQIHIHHANISDNSENDDADQEDNADIIDLPSENSSDYKKGKRKNGTDTLKNKTLNSVSALSTYFRIWKMNYNFRIKRREMIKTRLTSKYNLTGKNIDIQKKQQNLVNTEKQKEIKQSKLNFYKKLNYNDYQKISHSSE